MGNLKFIFCLIGTVFFITACSKDVLRTVPSEFQRDSASLCNISLVSWDGQSQEPKHLGTITRYVPIAEAGWWGLLHESEDGSRIEVQGIINADYNAEVYFEKLDANKNYVERLGILQMQGLGKTASLFLDDKFIGMLSCVSAK